VADVVAVLATFSISVAAFFIFSTAPSGCRGLPRIAVLNFWVARGTMSSTSRASACSELRPHPSAPRMTASVAAAPTALGSFAFFCNQLTIGVNA
jgi:hypothetical protein